MIAASSLWMAALYSPEADPLRVYYGTDTRAAGFLVGALLAMLWSPGAASQGSGRAASELLGWAGLLALMIFYTKFNEFQPLVYRGGILLTALASAVLIVGAASPGTLLGRLLETTVLRWVGSRSYSIYLWHWPVFMLTRPGFELDLPALPVRVGQVILTFVLAELSYRWVETPVRQHGFRESIRSVRAVFWRWSLPQRVGVGAGVVSASLLLFWQGSIHQVAVELPVTHLPTPHLPSTPTVNLIMTALANPTPVTTQQATQSSTQHTSTPRATATVDLPRVTLIGDSIMQGAAPMMDDVLGRDVYIDAARKRKMEDVPALVETLSDEGHLARVVVIHLGSNRLFEEAVFDQVMKRLLAHGAERVIFINVHRPIGWEDYLNRIFVRAVPRWPQAELIDWDAIAHSEQGWFIEDQTHLSYAGSEAYVNAIKEKLKSSP